MQPGREVHDGLIYRAGDALPANKGTAEDLVADGAVIWVAPVRAPRKPASQQRAKGKT